MAVSNKPATTTDPQSSTVATTPEAPFPNSRPGTNKGEAEFLEYSKARQTMTRRIAESKATIPHIYLQLEVDMAAAEEWRRGQDNGGGSDPDPSVTDLVIRAAALALTEHPRANATYRDGGLMLHPRINVGFAVDTDDGSLTPVIQETDRQSPAAIARMTRDLAAKARAGQLTPPEQAGATFAVSSLGMLGVTDSQPVVNPGQSAKLSVGRVLDRPVIRDGEVVPGRVMTLNLSCDHRALHGGEAARFLRAVGDLLESPEQLSG